MLPDGQVAYGYSRQTCSWALPSLGTAKSAPWTFLSLCVSIYSGVKGGSTGPWGGIALLCWRWVGRVGRVWVFLDSVLVGRPPFPPGFSLSLLLPLSCCERKGGSNQLWERLPDTGAEGGALPETSQA